MEEQTIVMMKPEALPRLHFIRKSLASVGRIVWSRSVHINTEVLSEIYRSQRSEFSKATFDHLSGQALPVFVIEGNSIIDRISTLVGNNTNPELCAEHTLRKALGFQLGFRSRNLGGGFFYYYNFLHCSRNEQEAVEHIKALTDPLLVSNPI